MTVSLRVIKLLAIGLVLSSLLLRIGGCATPVPAPPPAPIAESEILSQVTQLTRGFDRAGEAYFSPKMDWIVFQATPRGEKDYQMFVAPLTLNPAPGLGEPVRVSPSPSKNTCG